MAEVEGVALEEQTNSAFSNRVMPSDIYKNLVEEGSIEKPKQSKTESGFSAKDAVTFVASMTPIVGDVMAAKDIYDELQKDEPNYYLAGALGGAAIIGLIPGVGDLAAKAIKKGAKEVFDVAKRVEIDPTAVGSTAGNIKLKPKEPFNKTRSAYRIATQAEDGKLYPLFVNASDEIPVGEWISATVPPVTFKGANGNMYVPSKGATRSKGEKSKATGDMQTIPDVETADKLKEMGFSVEKPSKSAPFGKVRAVASRPGFHATTKPVAHHLGPEDLIITASERNKLLKAGVTPKAFKAKTFNYFKGKLISKKKVSELSAADKKKVKTKKKYYVKRRAEDQVFVEVDMADDTSEDLLKYMQERGRTDINDKLPSGGSYTYQDGQADAETWVVGGDMKVKRVLSREEAKVAQEAAGVKDLPHRDEIEKILGRKFNQGGLAGEQNMYTGQQDSILSTGTVDTASSFDNQTVQAFAIGGMASEVDPVSGNEVPPGSLPEEVRDDIPAMLSEGEYVVPADVLRYYGMKFFEDLRSEAKMGLSNMEADGRIGGEPVMDDDLPFSNEELVAMEMPSEEQVAAAKGGLMGYQEGGVTNPDFLKDQSVFGIEDILPGVSGGFGGIEYKEYINDKGRTISIPFFNGEPLGVIPVGFVAGDQQVVKEEEDRNLDDYGPSYGDEDQGPEPSKSYSSMSADELSKAYRDRPTATQKGIMGMLPGFGSIIGLMSNIDEKALSNHMEKYGIKASTITKDTEELDRNNFVDDESFDMYNASQGLGNTTDNKVESTTTSIDPDTGKEATVSVITGRPINARTRPGNLTSNSTSKDTSKTGGWLSGFVSDFMDGVGLGDSESTDNDSNDNDDGTGKDFT